MADYDILLPSVAFASISFWSFVILAILLNHQKISAKKAFSALIIFDAVNVVMFEYVIYFITQNYNLHASANLIVGLIIVPLFIASFSIIGLILSFALLRIIRDKLEYDPTALTDYWPFCFKLKVFGLILIFYLYPIIIIIGSLILGDQTLIFPLGLIVGFNLVLSGLVIFLPFIIIPLCKAMLKMYF